MENLDSTMIFNEHQRGVLELVFNEVKNEYIVNINVYWRISNARGNFYFQAFKIWKGKLAKTYSLKYFNLIKNNKIMNLAWFKRKQFSINKY